MPDDLFSVAGQIVLVSGASRGIGRAIAKGFAERGASVVITGRVAETLEKTAKEICPPGGTVRAKVCDVADATALQRLADEVAAEFGRIDTLVNCAGVNKRMQGRGLRRRDLRLHHQHQHPRGVFPLHGRGPAHDPRPAAAARSTSTRSTASAR